MYDSDEVRDAVRKEASQFYWQWTRAALLGEATTLLSPLDSAALDDALAAEGNPWQRAILDYVRASEGQPQQERLERIAAMVSAAMKKWAEDIAAALRPLVEQMRQAMAELGQRIVQGVLDGLDALAEALTSDEPEAAATFSWRRHGRKPAVRPVHLIDAVAADRHPAVTQRTQLRGGRR